MRGGFTDHSTDRRLDLSAVDGFDQTGVAGLAIAGGPQASEGGLALAAARFEPVK